MVGIISHLGLMAASLEIPHLSSLWSAWNFDPMVSIGLFLVGGVYGFGVYVLWRSAGVGRGLRVGQVVAFYVGWLTVAMALLSPLDVASSVLFSAHMVQHLLLIAVAAPLLNLGNVPYGCLWSLPKPARRALGRLWNQWPLLPSLWHLLTLPLVAWSLHTAVLWLWHVPRLYQAALVNDTIHALEHASFLGAALLFWWVLLRGCTRRDLAFGTGLIMAFTTMLHSSLLATLITFSRTAWYPNYVTNTAAWGITALADQQLAGVIMWVPMGMLYLVITLILLGMWLNSFAERDEGVLLHPGMLSQPEEHSL
jgi:putative membrane protein